MTERRVADTDALFDDIAAEFALPAAHAGRWPHYAESGLAAPGGPGG
ncbi:hypothetical protein AB0I68_13270 [Streptomyces sp. NPDC050448]